MRADLFKNTVGAILGVPYINTDYTVLIPDTVPESI